MTTTPGSEHHVLHHRPPNAGIVSTRQPVHPYAPDREAEHPGYEAEGMAQFGEALELIARAAENRSNPVDEYNSAAISGAGSSASLTVQPTYEMMPEKIETVIVTGPQPQQPAASVYGIANAPVAAGQQITSTTLQPGTYIINWTAGLGGTTGAVDANNFALELNGVTVATSVNPSTTGAVTAQTVLYLTVTQPNSVLSVNAGATTPTTTAIYRSSLTAASQGSAFTLQLGDRIWSLVLPPSGILVIGPMALLLSRTDARILTPSIPGIYTLELCGIADRRFKI